MKDDLLRLLMPQWQGGNNPAYYFGAQMLAWLAPVATGAMVQVPVAPPDGTALPLEQGIVGRTQLLRQLKSAQGIIEAHAPKRISVIGGDCLVDLAPFAYLSEKYGEKFGILWIDAHPDIMTPADFSHAHAMVLANLMGYGDPEFVAAVTRPVPPQRILYAGLGKTLDVEQAFIAKHGIAVASADEVAVSSDKVLSWMATQNIKQVAIHLDLDVLDATRFRVLLFANPNVAPSAFDGITQGTMRIHDVLRLVGEVQQAADVVGLGVTEHLPWDAIAMKDMLSQLPLMLE